MIEDSNLSFSIEILVPLCNDYHIQILKGSFGKNRSSCMHLTSLCLWWCVSVCSCALCDPARLHNEQCQWRLRGGRERGKKGGAECRQSSEGIAEEVSWGRRGRVGAADLDWTARICW